MGRPPSESRSVATDGRRWILRARSSARSERHERETRRKASALAAGVLPWERGCLWTLTLEHRARGWLSFFSRTPDCAYILANPVRAQLVKNETDWPYSGAIVPGYNDLNRSTGSFGRSSRRSTSESVPERSLAQQKSRTRNYATPPPQVGGYVLRFVLCT
jgi:hypothetical protein